MSIDLKKTFDIVMWEAVSTLKGYGFSSSLLQNNLELHFFNLFLSYGRRHPHIFFHKSKRGIREGDPLLLILFDKVMDLLSSLMEKEVKEKRVDTSQVN